ncbi:MAG: hypothetical protein DMF53_15835 [Acidobacteria bacterium]|nr:MAG: hypothetical protein DMF53_15835 [Acidobacteriota bacterium]
MRSSRHFFKESEDFFIAFVPRPLTHDGVETGVRALRLMKGFDVQLPNKDTSPYRLLVFRLFRGFRFRICHRLHLLAR